MQGLAECAGGLGIDNIDRILVLIRHALLPLRGAADLIATRIPPAPDLRIGGFGAWVDGGLEARRLREATMVLTFGVLGFTFGVLGLTFGVLELTFGVLELTFEVLGGLGGAFGVQKSVPSKRP